MRPGVVGDCEAPVRTTQYRQGVAGTAGTVGVQMIGSGGGAAEFEGALAFADRSVGRMRSAAIALWSMVDPPYFRAASFSGDVGAPVPRPVAIPEQPLPDPTIRRGGFGLLGDTFVAGELAPVVAESALCAA